MAACMHACWVVSNSLRSHGLYLPGKYTSLASPALAGGFFTTAPLGNPFDDSCYLVSKSCLTLLWFHGLQPISLCPWDFPGKNTGVDCYFLLQKIFLTQRSNPCLMHWQVDSLPLSHLESPCPRHFLIGGLWTWIFFSQQHESELNTTLKSFSDYIFLFPDMGNLR